ncbi:MAG: outer membrane lipoprotein carrier protein LolA [Betaproteobacteria bacterium]|nr:outer membrane lipoprotein carrier protein LolA [Betaproteobacteria bacterium]
MSRAAVRLAGSMAGCLVCAAGLAATAVAPFTAAQLMSSLATQREAVIAFTETRHSSLLKEPLVTTGELLFKPPSTLERRVTAPFEERYIIEGDQVTIERPGAGDPRTLSLGSQPLLANLVETIRALLRGDLRALDRLYRIELAGTRDNWALTLLPSDPAMVEFVATVRVTGHAGMLEEMEVIEPSGDRTVTRFEHAHEASR